MTEKPTIRYSEEWDKLNPNKRFKTGERHTTARGYKVSKHHYYRNHKGDIFNVELNDEIIGTARLLDVRPHLAQDLPIGFIKKDTYPHYTREDFDSLMEKYYNLSDIAVLVLRFQVVSVKEEWRDKHE